jgi:hypothetical protein
VLAGVLSAQQLTENARFRQSDLRTGEHGATEENETVPAVGSGFGFEAIAALGHPKGTSLYAFLLGLFFMLPNTRFGCIGSISYTGEWI